MTTTATPLRVTLIDESELALAGIAALLAPYADRVMVVDNRAVLARPAELDVLLYEPLDLTGTTDALLRDLQKRISAPSAVFSWAAVDQLPTCTARPYLPKNLTAAQLVVRIEELASGRFDSDLAYTRAANAAQIAVVAPPAPPLRPVASGGDGSGLTPRENDILELIVAGMSNREIGEELGLSLNSVKTYIRTAYRKMGVARRTQAMRWALEHGIGKELDGPSAAPAPALVG